MKLTSNFSFCESVWATSVSPWHIRKLTPKGKTLGGGTDTLSLCGESMGWDLATDSAREDLLCPACVRRYREVIQPEPDA